MAQRRHQEIKFNSINNIQQAYRDGPGSGSGNGCSIKGANGLNGPLTTSSQANSLKCQHIIYNSESYETLSKQSLANDASDGGETDDNMAKTALTSNKTYKKFVLPLDIPTPPMPHSYNLNKRLLSSHTQCQCDKQANFLQNHTSCNGAGGGDGIGNGNGCASMDSSNSNNNNNHIKNRLNHHISYIQPGSTTATTPPTIKENLILLKQQQQNKSSSSNSTISTTAGPYLNATDHIQQPPTASPQLLQHHHLCQQNNLKLQTYPNNQQHYHSRQQHQQQYQHHHHQQQQQQQHCRNHHQHHQHEEHLLAPQLSTSTSSFNAYGSQQYLPQLPQLLDSNYQQQQQQNSLTLSQRHMGRPRFNQISDKNYMKNLVYSPEQIRRLRIIVGIVGAIILMALLGGALFFILSGTGQTTQEETVQPIKTIQLEDILKGKYSSHHFNGSWSTGSNIIYKENNAIMEFNVLTKQKTRLILDTHQQYVFYEKSADGNYLLLTKNLKKNFRYSYLAEYDIYDVTTGQIKPLEIQNQVKSLAMVHWSPVGNALVINYDSNLYYKPTVFANEIAITNEGNVGILNGVPDWVYEEEIFGTNSATWFSPDGKKVAFIRFDDTPTQIMSIPIYGEAGDMDFQYPLHRMVPYPKAGSPNPRVKLFTSDLESALAGSGDHLTEIPVPSALNTEGDYLITVVGWLNNTNVMSVWMNRIQNSAHLQIFNGLSRQRAYSIESKTGWVEFFAAPFKNRDGSRIALLLPQAQSDGDEYRHLCVISTASPTGKPEALTKGRYVVTGILHWDNKNDIIFYTANTEKNPENLHIYAIKAAAGQTEKCITCNLHTSNGVIQTYYTAEFNSANQVVITSMGPSIPQVIVYEWSVGQKNEVSLKKLFVWEDNGSLRNKLKNIALPTVEMHTFNIADGLKAKVSLQLPPNMDRSGKTKYPMLVDVYGGPDSFSVINRWVVDWGTYLSSNQSIIYARIDGRGSSLQSQKLLHSIYLKLGTVEVIDQINVTKKLQERFNFIDANHTGIWGWSYGGYAAAMVLASDDKHVFRCAASIAPVTDWTYYDSIYTERYMGLPSINEKGYAVGRLSTKAQKLKGKKFLLVHGTLDDNVHYQQSMVLAKNLEKHDILFKQISYPDEDHALNGVRPHLFHSLDRFFGECFQKKRMMAHSK